MNPNGWVDPSHQRGGKVRARCKYLGVTDRRQRLDAVDEAGARPDERSVRVDRPHGDVWREATMVDEAPG